MGVQRKTPVTGSIVIPAATDAESRRKLSTFGGTSESDAVATKLSSDPSATDWLPIASRTGAEFASSTVIVIGLYLVLALEATGPRRARWVGVLCAALLGAYVAVLAVPALRSFYALAVPEFATLIMIVVGASLAIGFLRLTDDRFVPLRGAGVG